MQVSVLDSEVTKRTTLLTEAEEKVAQLQTLMVSKEAEVRKMEERQAKQEEMEDRYRAEALALEEKLRKTEEALKNRTSHILEHRPSGQEAVNLKTTLEQAQKEAPT